MRVENLRQDVRYGIRGLMRERSFACTTIATLAIALSLVTVVFAIFNAYVLRPYAVRDPYSLYEIRWRTQDAGGGHVPVEPSTRSSRRGRSCSPR